MFRRIQIQANDGFQFAGKLRITADLERLDQVRLESMCVPDTAHACLAKLAWSRLTIMQVGLLIAKTKLLDRLRGHINDRQQKAFLRIFREGPDGFKGGMSAGNYGTITGASHDWPEFWRATAPSSGFHPEGQR
jgi:hypothetical protein